MNSDEVFRGDLLTVLGRIAAALERGAPPLPPGSELPASGSESMPASDLAAVMPRAAGIAGPGEVRTEKGQQCPQCHRRIPLGQPRGVQFAAHEPGCLEAARYLPQPKGYLCAGDCGHRTATHSAVGCMSSEMVDGGTGLTVCPCELPYGRIMPAGRPGGPVGDDLPPLDR